MMNISNLLGAMYEVLDDAKIDLQPGEVVVTDNDETYYVVKRNIFDEQLSPFNYRMVG